MTAHDDGTAIAWTVLSFFASEPDVQLAYLGETDLVFLPVDNSLDRRANYLIALHFVFIVYRNAFFDDFDLEEDGAMVELREWFKSMFWFRVPTVWEVERLRDHRDWAEVRQLARRVLAQSGLGIQAPLAAIDVEYEAAEFALDGTSPDV